MALDLAELGLTKEELQERVVDAICERLLSRRGMDDEGDAYIRSSTLRTELDAAITKRVADAVNAVADKHVLPVATQRIESLVIQHTNSWGEKKGEPLTFVEYLIQRADAYMQEKVNYKGEGEKEAGGYSWTGTQTRLTCIMHQHIQHYIEQAMKQMLGTGLDKLGKAMAETCRIQLEQISKKVTADIKVG